MSQPSTSTSPSTLTTAATAVPRPPIADYDVAIIGGGPAGLTAAIAATRTMMRSIVLEAPTPPRNAASRGAHGLLGLDTADPAEVRRRAWADLDRYRLATPRTAVVTDIHLDTGGGFLVETAGVDGTEPGQTVWARDVVLATGVVDVHPDVPGFADCWGKTVIHCPFCVGWENQDRPWAMVNTEPEHALMTARAFGAWSGDIVGIVPPDMPRLDEVRVAYDKAGRELVVGEITALGHDDGSLRTVEFADGRTLARGTLLWHLRQRPVALISRLAATLALEVDERGFVTADADRRTNIPGIYAAGDLTVPMGQNALLAVASGGAAITGIMRRQMMEQD